MSRISLPGGEALPVPTDEERSDAFDLLASTRCALSGWMLGVLVPRRVQVTSLETPEHVREDLEAALRSGIVQLVASEPDGEWFPRRSGEGATTPALAAIAQGVESEATQTHARLATDTSYALALDRREQAMEHNGSPRGASTTVCSATGSSSATSQAALRSDSRADGLCRGGLRRRFGGAAAWRTAGPTPRSISTQRSSSPCPSSSGGHWCSMACLPARGYCAPQAAGTVARRRMGDEDLGRRGRTARSPRRVTRVGAGG